MNRTTAIEKSLSAFVNGIFGFIPVLGCVPAIYALVCWREVQNQYGKEWNPAARYLSWGARLGAFGLLGTALIALLAALTFWWHVLL